MYDIAIRNSLIDESLFINQLYKLNVEDHIKNYDIKDYDQELEPFFKEIYEDIMNRYYFNKYKKIPIENLFYLNYEDSSRKIISKENYKIMDKTFEVNIYNSRLVVKIEKSIESLEEFKNLKELISNKIESINPKLFPYLEKIKIKERGNLKVFLKKNKNQKNIELDVNKTFLLIKNRSNISLEFKYFCKNKKEYKNYLQEYIKNMDFISEKKTKINILLLDIKLCL
jgi:hypothetical protein